AVRKTLEFGHADGDLPEASMNLLRGAAGAFVITLASVGVLFAGLVTLFRARWLYSAIARLAARAVLAIYGVSVRVQGQLPFPRTQTVYISNHTSTLDLFVLVALGLPNCRFFLSGYLKKFVPLGIIAW